jgi:hypothetical protein
MNDDPIDEARDVRAWNLLARVVEDDPIDTLLSEDGAVLGIKVDCTIIGGPFPDARVSAVLLAPLGQETPRPPRPGQTVMLILPSGHPDGGCYCAHVVPGGENRPMKSAVAGVDMTKPETFGAYQVNAPGKGVGSIDYRQGAPFVVRLKGKSDGFHADFYVDADDGTYVRLLWNPATQSYAIKLRDSKGAYVAVGDGSVSMQSANAENGVYVTDEGVKILGSSIEINGSDFVKLDGGFVGLCLGAAQPVPAVNSVLYGATGLTGLPTPRVYVGVV